MSDLDDRSSGVSHVPALTPALGGSLAPDGAPAERADRRPYGQDRVGSLHATAPAEVPSGCGVPDDARQLPLEPVRRHQAMERTVGSPPGNVRSRRSGRAPRQACRPHPTARSADPGPRFTMAGNSHTYSPDTARPNEAATPQLPRARLLERGFHGGRHPGSRRRDPEGCKFGAAVLRRRLRTGKRALRELGDAVSDEPAGRRGRAVAGGGCPGGEHRSAALSRSPRDIQGDTGSSESRQEPVARLGRWPAPAADRVR